MWNPFRDKNNCFCAFCKTPRKIYRKKSINLLNVLASVLAAGVFMYAIWQDFDPRVMIVFVVCLAFSEAFIKLRWRLSMFCSQCGFDPVLYIKHPNKAAEKVKAHLDRRKEDPKYLLARPLNLPALSPEQAKLAHAREKKGSLVSKQI